MSERKVTDKQRSWCGDHVPNPAQYRYGMIPGTERPEIESTVELSEKEVETIRTRIRGSRSCVRPRATRDTSTWSSVRRARSSASAA